MVEAVHPWYAAVATVVDKKDDGNYLAQRGLSFFPSRANNNALFLITTPL
jgi:hypothetical protein